MKVRDLFRPIDPARGAEIERKIARLRAVESRMRVAVGDANRPAARIPRWIHVQWFAISLAAVIALEARYLPYNDPVYRHPPQFAAHVALMAWLYCSRWMR